jgi:hypothetical protein
MELHVDLQVLLRDAGRNVEMAWMSSWRIGIGVTWYRYVSDSYMHARQELPYQSVVCTEHSRVGRAGQEFESTEHVQEIASTVKITLGRRVTCLMQVTLFRRSRRTRTRAHADRTERAGTQ